MLAHLLLSPTLHTQLHHLTISVHLKGSYKWLGLIHGFALSIAIFWESVINLTLMCKAIFHLHFQEYFWNSLRALYFVQAGEWGQSGNAVKRGRKLSKLGIQYRHFHWPLVSYSVQKWETFKFHPWNRRKEHLELLMIFLFSGSHNYVYESPRIWDEAWCKSDKHWLHRTRRCFMLSPGSRVTLSAPSAGLRHKGLPDVAISPSLLMLASSPPWLRLPR